MNKENIGRLLKELRLSRGWRQTEVADKTGLSRPAISNIESGKRALTLVTLQKFCELYKIDISYFGIETNTYDEVADIKSRIEKLFQSEDLCEEKKDELHREIMQMYLDSKK